MALCQGRKRSLLDTEESVLGSIPFKNSVNKMKTQKADTTKSGRYG